jgi:hypothetical protein
MSTRDGALALRATAIYKSNPGQEAMPKFKPFQSLAHPSVELHAQLKLGFQVLVSCSNHHLRCISQEGQETAAENMLFTIVASVAMHST